MLRLTRKDEHIISALRQVPNPTVSGFGDIIPVHNALPEVSEAEISLSISLFGKLIETPMIINAITGGGIMPYHINESLSLAARETGLAMAVGSQTIALENPDAEQSFRVVRKTNPHGMIIANIGADRPAASALRAVEMVEADALQLHLNVPQEIFMREGERSFKGLTDNIGKVVKTSPVPVIVKEVGFGISREVACRLHDIGVRHFDVGGRGGTNFIAVENLRRNAGQTSLEQWGIATPVSLIEIETSGIAETIIATGGLSDGLDVARVLALGAHAAGIAGPYLKVLMEGNTDMLIQRIGNIKSDLKKIMLMLGVRSPGEMKKVPLVITGKTREWLIERQIDTTCYATRPGPG